MDLEPTVDLTGNMSDIELLQQDVSNIMDNLNSANDTLNTLGQSQVISQILNETYTMTSDDLSAGYVNIQFPHGLAYIPLVTGAITNSSDGATRMLPVFQHASNGVYYGESFSSSIVIESIDANNINIRVDIIDISGLSFLAANTMLTFVLYCSQQIASTNS